MSANQENLPPTTSFKVKILGKAAKPHTKPTSTKQKQPKAPPKPPKQTKWSAENSAKLIRVLTEQQAARNQVDNAWKGCVWTTAELALHGSELISGSVKDMKKCNGHWDKVRIYMVCSCPTPLTYPFKLKAEFLAVQPL